MAKKATKKANEWDEFQTILRGGRPNVSPSVRGIPPSGPRPDPPKGHKPKDKDSGEEQDTGKEVIIR